jgi:hypothetical protein
VTRCGKTGAGHRRNRLGPIVLVVYGDADKAGIQAEILIISRAANGAEYRAGLTPDGNVQPWQNAPLGAVCIGRGAILRDHQAIPKGVGRSCAHRSGVRRGNAERN